MLIERISLQGFRSYEEAELDLCGVAAAVIFGNTGSGKSSLLDALLWALYGRTRSKGGDGYIRLGADECRVAVDLRADGSMYRVVRTRSLKTKKGKSDLQLLVAADCGWTPITGKSIGDTEEAIRRLIGVDYDTLVCSVLSPQGESDRFTTPPRISIDGKTYEGAAARIQVLAQMLGLGTYETWRRAAAQGVTTRTAQVDAVERQIAEAQGRLAERPTTEAALQQAEADAALAQGTITAEESRKAGLDAVLRALSQDQAVLRERLTALETTRRQRDGVSRRLTEAEAQASRWEKILAHEEAVRAKAAEDAGLALELEGARQALAETEAHIASLARQETALVKAAATHRAGLEKERNGIEVQRRTERAQAEGTAQAAKAMLETCEKQAAVLSQVPCLGVDDLPNRCPLLAHGRTAADRAQVERARLSVALAWAPDAAQIERLTALETLLAEARGDGSEGIRHQRLTLEASLRALREAVADLGSQRKAIERWVALVPELAVAAAELPKVRAQETAAREELGGLDASLAEMPALEAKAQELRHQESDLGVALSTCAGGLGSLRARERVALTAIAQHRAALELLNGLSRAVAAWAHDIAVARQEARIFGVLADAYKAIPILVLENVAIPYLEEAANSVLAQAGTTGMRLELRTQKALKTKDALVDALDIVVRDHVGERALEDFSGGQRFLVDLALRLALAKLQQRRAGRTLETLILDEGFGALDPGTLGRVRRMLAVAQEDFRRLLLISHVEEMRNLFPVQIAVSGGPEKSVVEVLR